MVRLKTVFPCTVLTHFFHSAFVWPIRKAGKKVMNTFPHLIAAIFNVQILAMRSAAIFHQKFSMCKMKYVALWGMESGPHSPQPMSLTTRP